MIRRFSLFLLRICAILLAVIGVWYYLGYRTPRVVEYASEQRDHSENRVVKQAATQIGAQFTAFPVKSPVTALAGSWPCFRGANRDNVCADPTPLQKTWGAEGPRVLWRQPLGEGYSGAIIADGRVYVLDYLDQEVSDALRCFELLTGKELWRRGYRNPIRRNHGKSRTVPACAEQVVVSLGPAAHVMAVQSASGELLWGVDLVKEYQAEVPQWYCGQCPLIDHGKVILGIGGKEALLAAFDLKTGKRLWQVPNDKGIKMSHSSVLATTLCGRRQYVYGGIGGITACSEEGVQLWQCRDWKPAVWAPTPVKLDEHRLFLTAGYGAGSAVLAVSEANGVFSARIEQQWKPAKGPSAEQQTPLMIGGMLFTIQPKDAGALRSELLASEITALPKITAASGREARFGLGSYLYADGAFWILDDEGVLQAYRYANGGFTCLARHKVLPGVDSWGPIACAGGLMIVRDSTSMACLDLRLQ